MHIRVVVVVATLALAACASTDEVTRERCERLRDHVVEAQLAKLPSSLAPPGVVTPADPRGSDFDPKHVELPAAKPDVEGHRAALTQALGEAYVASCQKNLTGAQLTCALAAPDSTTIAECQTSK